MKAQAIANPRLNLFMAHQTSVSNKFDDSKLSVVHRQDVSLLTASFSVLATDGLCCSCTFKRLFSAFQHTGNDNDINMHTRSTTMNEKRIIRCGAIKPIVSPVFLFLHSTCAFCIVKSSEKNSQITPFSWAP